MIGLQYEEEDGIFYIEGIINERCDFTQFFSDKEGTITLNMAEVRRINSTGVRRWTEALHQYPELKITLEECPREIIDQCNMIPEFMGKKQVHITSFYAHYYDEDTDEEEVVLLEENEHYKWGEGLIKDPELPEGMELDDNPNKYFRFLSYYSE